MGFYQKTIYLPATMDLFHIGHLRAIRKCEKFGKVIIGLLSDEAIKNYKGKTPIIPFIQRKKIIDNIKGSHIAVKQSNINPFLNLKKYKPNFVASGDGFELEELEAIKKVGCRAVHISYYKPQSTTLIKQKICQKDA